MKYLEAVYISKNSFIIYREDNNKNEFFQYATQSNCIKGAKEHRS